MGCLNTRFSQRATSDTKDYWPHPEEDNDNYEEDETEDYEQPVPTRKRRRKHILDDDNKEQEEHEPFNTPESSGERSLFITQPNPEPFHEDGMLSRAEKGNTPV